MCRAEMTKVSVPGYKIMRRRRGRNKKPKGAGGLTGFDWDLMTFVLEKNGIERMAVFLDV